MRRFTDILHEAGWKPSFAPAYFLGFDISWLVMREVFISPYDGNAYSFDEAMRQEAPYLPEVAAFRSAA